MVTGEAMWLGKHFPDLRAYNVALSACESSGRWRQARPIFVRFEADFIRFQALLLLKLMKKRRLRPDEVRFNCMEPFVRNRRSRWPRWGRPARGAVWPGFSAWRSTCRLVLEGFRGFLDGFRDLWSRRCRPKSSGAADCGLESQSEARRHPADDHAECLRAWKSVAGGCEPPGCGSYEAFEIETCTEIGLRKMKQL